MTEGNPFNGNQSQDRPVLEAGVYDAEFVSWSDRKPGMHGDYVFWNFRPVDHPDVEVSMVTSADGGWRSKPMEIARRLKGKSAATDTKWGLDIKDKRPIINFGPEMFGTKCQIVVEKDWDEDFEVHRNRVVNVLPSGKTKVEEDAAAEEEEDFESIPF
jgi:hypothetical protein